MEKTNELLESLLEHVRRSHIDLRESERESLSEDSRGRTLVTTQTTGTERASATERCSFDMPIKPAFAPTMSSTKLGLVAVRPNKVVLR